MDRFSGVKRKRPSGPSFPGAPTLFDEGKSSSSLKNRIRSLKRLLSRPGLAKQAVKDKKRLLKKLEQQLEDSKFKASEFKQGARYHKVKFFERQKITRAIHKTERYIAALQSKEETTTTATKDATAAVEGEDAEDGDFGVGAVLHADECARIRKTSKPAKKISAAQQLLQQLQTDIIYTKWYPRHCKYVALLPSAKGAGESSGESDDGVSSDDEGGKSDSKMEKKLERIKRMRLWSLANASAGQFLRKCPEELPESVEDIIARRFGSYADGRNDDASRAPTQALPEDIDGDDDDDEEEDGDEDEDEDGDAVSRRKAKAAAKKPVKAVTSTTSATKGKGHRELASEDDGSDSGSSVSSTPLVLPPKKKKGVPAAAGGDKGKGKEKAEPSAEADPAAAPIKPAAKAAPLRSAPTRIMPKAADEDDEVDNKGDGDEEDPFFAAGGASKDDVAGVTYDEEGLPIFREEAPEEIREDAPEGGYEKFYGPRTSAARWEREHIHKGRYRDAAVNRNPTEDGGRAGGRDGAPDFSHLSDRKRRRAERGLAFASVKDGSGIGPGKRFTEAFFGTEMDTGAGLKSVRKVQQSVAKEAGSGPRGSAPPLRKPYGAGGSNGAPAGPRYGGANSGAPAFSARPKPSIAPPKPNPMTVPDGKAPTHLKFVD